MISMALPVPEPTGMIVVVPVALPPICSVSVAPPAKLVSRVMAPPPMKLPEVAKLPVAPSFRFSDPATVSVVAVVLPRTVASAPLCTVTVSQPEMAPLMVPPATVSVSVPPPPVSVPVTVPPVTNSVSSPPPRSTTDATLPPATASVSAPLAISMLPEVVAPLFTVTVALAWKVTLIALAALTAAPLSSVMVTGWKSLVGVLFKSPATTVALMPA